MGTRGILYIYFKYETEDSNYLALRLKYDSKIQLIELRKKFLRIKTIKALEKLIDSLEEDENLFKDDEAPEILSTTYCWPFLEYSLQVTVEEKENSFQVLVDLVQETISETEFKAIKGQRMQDRRTPEQRAADKEAKAEEKRKQIERLNWSDDGIHGHELCLQREWTSELKKTTDSKRQAQLKKLIEESKARLPQKASTPAPKKEEKVEKPKKTEKPKKIQPKKAIKPKTTSTEPKKRGRPKKILTEAEIKERKAIAAAKTKARRQAKKAAEILIAFSQGPPANAPRSVLAPWIATQN